MGRIGDRCPDDDRDGEQLERHIGPISGSARAAEHEAKRQVDRDDGEAETSGSRAALRLDRQAADRHLCALSTSPEMPSSLSHWAGSRWPGP